MVLEGCEDFSVCSSVGDVCGFEFVAVLVWDCEIEHGEIGKAIQDELQKG